MNYKIIAIAISKLSSAIEYLTWAIEADDEKAVEEWKNEAERMMEIAQKWLNK